MFFLGDLLYKQYKGPVDEEAQAASEPDHIGLKIDPPIQETIPEVQVEFQNENIGHKRLDVSDEAMQKTVDKKSTEIDTPKSDLKGAEVLVQFCSG